MSKVLDFTVQADTDNFVLMIVHQDDLVFSVGQGLMRYTRGNVLTSIAPDTGLDRSTATRSWYTAAASSLSTLWVVAEGRLSEYSSILALDEGKWHPLYSEQGIMLRSLVLEPGYRRSYEAPTMHFAHQLAVSSMQMPTTTRRTWTWEGMDFNTTANGIFYASWFDGGIRVIEKDWINCLIDVAAQGTGSLGSVDVYWRPDEATAWVQLGTQVTTEGLHEFAFPAASHSMQMQLKVVILGGSDGCLMVKALVTGYMERPDDLRMYTRSYRLASLGTWRNGTPITLSLAEQVASLRTLRAAAEPLAWYPWYGGSRNVHIVDYNAVEAPEEQRPAGDIGSITVTLRLVEV